MTNFVSVKDNNNKEEKEMSKKRENQKKSDGKQTKASKDLRGSRTTEVPEWATEVPEFIPTRRELLQIVKYWYIEDLYVQWTNFRFPECNMASLYGLSRIRDIRKLLSKEEVDKAIEQAIDDAKHRFGKNPLRCDHQEDDTRHWDIFLHGDQEQWKAAHDELVQDVMRWLKEQEEEEKGKENLGA